MSAHIPSLAVAMLMLGASLASAQKVTTDFDQTVDFSTYRTYYWVETQPTANDLMNQRLVAAVDEWLAAAGWTLAPEGDADIAVVPNVSVRQGESVHTFYDGWSGWGWNGWETGTATTVVTPFTEGTLLIDLFDARTKRLVWRGTATDTVSDDPEKNAKKIRKAAEKMFKKDFPPEPDDD